MAGKAKKPQGFAAIDPARQREIASMGGKSVPDENRSFSRDPALAASAGRKGGKNIAPEKRSFSIDRELAVSAGRKGGSRLKGNRSRAY